MKVRAHSRDVRISPRKVGVVASLVRNRTVEDALTILDHTPRRAAPTIAKIIESARSNAENNHNIKPDTLVISEINIGPARSLKRYRPAAHGRANPYKKRSTHITVIVEGQERVKKSKKTEKPVAKEKADKETDKPETKKEKK